MKTYGVGEWYGDGNVKLKVTLAADSATQPCGHAAHWLASRNPVDAQSERYCVFCRIAELDAENARMLKSLKQLVPLVEIDCPEIDAIVHRAVKVIQAAEETVSERRMTPGDLARELTDLIRSECEPLDTTGRRIVAHSDTTLE